MASYTAKDITVLEGLEPVRRRPGMYIGGVGSAGLHHLVWEILDNAVDEAMNGYASNITVTLHDDASSITVTDDGPYAVGGIDLAGVKFGDGASTGHYTLCRCGSSKNKPFCDGTHWSIGFKDPNP